MQTSVSTDCSEGLRNCSASAASAGNVRTQPDKHNPSATHNREIGFLLPGWFLDAVAGIPASKKTEPGTAKLLKRLNGRPLLSWISQSFLKSTRASSAKLYVLDGECSEVLDAFVRAHFPEDLIEVVPGDDMEGNLARILCEESGSASSVTLLRCNALSIADKLERSGNMQGLLDGRLVVWHADVGSAALIGTDGNGERLQLRIDAYSRDRRFSRTDIRPSSCIIVETDRDLDEAKTRLIESRTFNTLKIHPLFPEIIKSSRDSQKLKNEVFWYRELPDQFKALAPQVFSCDEAGIRMEYYGYGTLAEKFLYDDLPAAEWRSILQKLFKIVSLFSEHHFEFDQHVFQIFYCNKFEKRCEKAAEIPEIKRLFSLEKLKINGEAVLGLPALLPFIRSELREIAQTARGTLCHGDLCFNNILYDRKTGIIKLIDPRGNIEGIPSIMCDPRYDIAKLKHSYCGGYDRIVEGEFFVNESSEGCFDFIVSGSNDAGERESVFKELCAGSGFDSRIVDIIEAYLFLTMIPLHTDSLRKMKAFFLTAILKFNRCMEHSENANLH